MQGVCLSHQNIWISAKQSLVGLREVLMWDASLYSSHQCIYCGNICKNSLSKRCDVADDLSRKGHRDNENRRACHEGDYLLL